MDVNIINGNGGVDHNPKQKATAGTDMVRGERAYELPRADSASISSTGKDLLAKAEALTARLRQSDGGRAEIVDQARQRLENGELQRPDVFDVVARSLLNGSDAADLD